MRTVDSRMAMQERERLALQRVASDDGAKFWVSWLEEQGFCEYKLCLKRRGVVAPASADATLGIERHTGLQVQHDITAEPVESVGAAVSQAIGFGHSTSIAECGIQGTRLTGTIDEVRISPSVVHVIDNKPRPWTGEPHYGQQRQALGYAVAWSQAYPYYYFVGSIVAVIRDRDTMEWLWEKKLDDTAIQEVEERLDSIRAILRDPRLARDTANSNKCRSCSYHSSRLCDRDKC